MQDILGKTIAGQCSGSHTTDLDDYLSARQGMNFTELNTTGHCLVQEFDSSYFEQQVDCSMKNDRILCGILVLRCNVLFLVSFSNVAIILLRKRELVALL